MSSCSRGKLKTLIIWNIDSEKEFKAKKKKRDDYKLDFKDVSNNLGDDS